jgi:hypothetical protein
MKKSVLKWLSIGLSAMSLLLIMSNFIDKSSEPSVTKEQKYKQEFIILDSVDNDYFEKANIHYMDESGKPAPIPNFDLDKPIVITKMPVVDKKVNANNEDKVK